MQRKGEGGNIKEKAINITLIAYSKGEMSRMKDSNIRFLILLFWNEFHLISVECLKSSSKSRLIS